VRKIEESIAKHFLGLKVAFKSSEIEGKTLTGIVKEVTNTTILIDFKGRLQSHLLKNIYYMEQSISDEDD